MTDWLTSNQGRSNSSPPWYRWIGVAAVIAAWTIVYVAEVIGR